MLSNLEITAAVVIAKKHSGAREKAVLNSPHIFEQGETWNDDHKVIYILAADTGADGYRDGFGVDLVTRSICC